MDGLVGDLGERLKKDLIEGELFLEGALDGGFEGVFAIVLVGVAFGEDRERWAADDRLGLAPGYLGDGVLAFQRASLSLQTIGGHDCVSIVCIVTSISCTMEWYQNGIASYL